MPKSTVSSLRNRSIVVKTETAKEANTALRVGSLFEDIVDSLVHQDDVTSYISGKTIFRLSSMTAGQQVVADNYYEHNGFLFRCTSSYVLASDGQYLQGNFIAVGISDPATGTLFGRNGNSWVAITAAQVPIQGPFSGVLAGKTNVQQLAEAVDSLSLTAEGFDVDHYAWIASPDQTSYVIPSAPVGEISRIISVTVGGVPQQIYNGIIVINGSANGITISADVGEIGSEDVVTLTYAKGVAGSGPIIGSQAVQTRYISIFAMLADQASQISGALQFVEDASADDSVEEGWAYYEYLGTVTGTLEDYRKISEQESLDTEVFEDQTPTGDIESSDYEEEI